ncbi:MAG TPA: Gfo/Idh/MocA family oxidoreductase [Sphingobacteriaceae bacterium]|nr:Gfo/Idh/MocA family oxidoreductase [Sphingobacteriaceae bacterium]
MDQQVITGLLSYGMSGKIFHAPYLLHHPGFQLKAVTERSKKLASKDYPGIISYDTVSAMLNDPEIELVIVNTPNNTHAEFARQALKAGKHVLVEKPFAISSGEAKEVFDLSRKLGRKVMVYQNRRFSSDFLSLKNVINSGKLGDIIEVHLRYDRYRNFIGPKIFKETPIAGSGIFYDLGAHLIDQAISLFGNPASSFKTLGKYRKDSQVDDYAHLHLVFPGELNVFITVSMLVAAPLPGITVHGTKGSYIKELCDTQEDQLLSGMSPADEAFGEEHPGKEGLLTIINSESEKNVELIPSLKGDYGVLFEAVYQTIRNDALFPITEEQIMQQLKLLES